MVDRRRLRWALWAIRYEAVITLGYLVLMLACLALPTPFSLLVLLVSNYSYIGFYGYLMGVKTFVQIVPRQSKQPDVLESSEVSNDPS